MAGSVKGIVYPQVDYLLWENKLTVTSLSQEIGMLSSTMHRKLRGKSPLMLDEAIAIRDALGSNMPLEELFAREEAAHHGLRAQGAE